MRKRVIKLRLENLLDIIGFDEPLEIYDNSGTTLCIETNENLKNSQISGFENIESGSDLLGCEVQLLETFEGVMQITIII
jgi:hypothetical protein